MKPIRLSLGALFLAKSTSADPNPNISNGTCYYADGQRAPSEFIPCGNTAIGHVTCCAAGDNCLADSACYGSGGVTYVAGCTDQNYDDQICPMKAVDYQDREWVGLVFCGNNEWGACNNTGSTVVMQLGCTCSGPIAFTDSSVLSNIMSLPPSAGRSVSWFPPYGAGNAYTGSSSAGSTASSSSSQNSGATATATVGPLSPPTGASMSPSNNTNQASVTSPSQSTGASSSSSTPFGPDPAVGPKTTPLSAEQKIGIGVGAGAGGILAVALVWLAIMCIRKRKNRAISPVDDQIRPRSGLDSGISARKTAHDFDDPRSPTWSGHKSELPADISSIVSPSASGHEWERPQSQELPDSSGRSSHVYGSMASGRADTSATYIPYSQPIAEEVEGSPRPGCAGTPVGPGIYEMPA